MSIYVTPEQKLEWEIEIYELKTKLHQLPSYQVVGKNLLISQIEIYENLIANSIVLQEVKNWDQAISKIQDSLADFKHNNPNGIIIKN